MKCLIKKLPGLFKPNRLFNLIAFLLILSLVSMNWRIDSNAKMIIFINRKSTDSLKGFTSPAEATESYNQFLR